MKRVPANRGQPLVALGAILGGWVLMRAIFWDIAGLPTFSAEGAPAFANAKTEENLHGPASKDRDQDEPKLVRTELGIVSASALTAPGQAKDWQGVSLAPGGDLAGTGAHEDEASSMPVPFITPSPVPVRVAATHQMLWMAALSRIPLPMSVLAPEASEKIPVPFYEASRRRVSARRWSGDSWLLLRRGGSSSLVSGGRPATYGASQAGAVIRYRLDTESNHRPSAYLRATAAVNGAPDKDVAIGLSARPIRDLPVVAAIEIRASDQAGGTSLRPAAMMYTQIRPIELPAETRAEFYAQAGYVGGSFKTGFVDGQLRIDRRVAALGKSELRAGGGTWAGAQKGAARIDIGPTATMGIPLGEAASGRVAVDWRIRVEGNARPDSGPAITLSAGF